MSTEKQEEVKEEQKPEEDKKSSDKKKKIVHPPGVGSWTGFDYVIRSNSPEVTKWITIQKGE